MRRLESALVRPAILEAVLMVTALAVTVVAGLAGLQLASTALIEFAMLSGVAAASAGLLLARYALRIFGVLFGSRYFDMCAVRLRVLCYCALGLYALGNAVLDLALPRRDNDPMSYPGLACAVVAVTIVALVLETKYRVLQAVPSRMLFESLVDDTFYLTAGIISLAALVGHIFAPSWWLDTVIDAIFLVLMAVRLGSLSANRTYERLR